MPGGNALIDSSVRVVVDSDTGTAGNQAGALTETHVLTANQRLYRLAVRLAT